MSSKTVRTHTENEALVSMKFPVKIASVPVKTRSSKSQVVVKKSGMYGCARCGKLYKLRSSLNRHLRYECGHEPQFHCTECPYRAKLREHLKSHYAAKHVTTIIKSDPDHDYDHVLLTGSAYE